MALDFVAGCIGGFAGVIVGHPLDTVKVHLQTQDARNPRYSGTIHCIKSLMAKEGAKSLYKGMSSPLVGVAAINAIIFGIYGNTQRRLTNPDSLSSHAIAGATAGFCQSFFCGPMELAKSRLQVGNSTKGPLNCLRMIYKSEGIKGVFRGLNMTVMREIPAFSSYFVTYEWLSRSSDGGPVSTSAMLMAGGMAGIVSWVVVYPVDVIKSRMQIDGLNGLTTYKNSWDCLTKGLKGEGPSFLYRGLSPAVLRAFPVNAATFAVVTWTMRLMSGDALFGVKEHAKNIRDDGEMLLWDAVCTLKVSDGSVIS